MPFVKGQSGNPKGRTKGVPSKATRLRALIETHAESLVAKAVALAEQGDTTALRLCLERLIPALKTEGKPVTLHTLHTAGTLTEQGRAVFVALGEGGVTPDEAASLLHSIAAQARIEEFDELKRRVESLESRANQSGSR